MAKVTTISLPYKLSDACEDVLTKEGFTVGSSGSGTNEWEKEGDLSEVEEAALRQKLLAAINEKLVYIDVNDDEDEDEDEAGVTNA